MNYTVLINPEGKTYLDGGRPLNLKDVLSYKKITYENARVSWQVDLMPGTVKFREAIKQDDGTYKPGEVISDCKWTYDSQEASNEWEYSSKTINAIVPDGKAIMLTYTYSVKGDLLQEAKLYGMEEAYRREKLTADEIYSRRTVRKRRKSSGS